MVYRGLTRAPFLVGQVYGQPRPSLMSPSSLQASKPSTLAPFLRVKISTMERNRKDLLVRFDASVSSVYGFGWSPSRSSPGLTC